MLDKMPVADMKEVGNGTSSSNASETPKIVIYLWLISVSIWLFFCLIPAGLVANVKDMSGPAVVVDASFLLLTAIFVGAQFTTRVQWLHRMQWIALMTNTIWFIIKIGLGGVVLGFTNLAMPQMVSVIFSCIVLVIFAFMAAALWNTQPIAKIDDVIRPAKKWQY
jgi:hypothetical protein